MKLNFYLKSLTLSFFILLSFSGYAQLEVGSGTTVGTNLPVEPYYGYSYTQTIYLQSDINTSGTITAIEYYCEGTDLSSTDDNVDVWIGHTTESSFAGTASWIPVSSLTQVFTNGTMSYTTLPGWVTITLSTPFVYNNVDNLVIAVDANETGYDGSSDDFYATSTPTSQSIVYYNDSNNPSPTSPPSGTLKSFIPNTRFVGLTVTLPPNCTSLTTPADGATGINVDTDLAWTAATGSPDGYKLTVGTSSGGNDVLDNVDVGSATTYDIGTMSYSTTYYVTITPYNTYGDASGCIETSFTTEPDPTIIAPFFESFESFPTTTNGTITTAGWTTNPVGPSVYFRWDLDGGGSTPSSSTGPNLGAHDGSKYLYTEASSGVLGSIAEVISPPIDVSGLSSPFLSFYYHMYGAYMGTLHVDIESGGVWTNDVTSIVGQQHAAGDPWTEKGVDLSAFSGIIKIRFRGERGSGYESDMCVDAVSVIEAPTCIKPEDLSASNITGSSADLSWTAVGGSTLWNLEWGTAGFSQGTGTLVSGVSTNPYALSGLTSSTDFEFYVQADCGSDGTSPWAGPFSFSTPVDYCGGDVLYDSGGPSGDYGPNENTDYVICPANSGDKISVTFTQFSFENSGTGCFDGLTIYNGNSTSAPVIPSPSGSTTKWCWDRDDFTPSGSGDLLGKTIVSTDASGCLLINLSSDGSVYREGFAATFTCGTPTLPNDLSIVGEGEGAFTSDKVVITGDGWYHYYNDAASKILVSLMLGGTDAVIADDAVSVNANASGAANLGLTGCSAPYTNQDEWWVMQRTWDVNASSQPSSSVDLRFYYNTSEFNAVASSVSDGSIVSHSDMTFYKIGGSDEEDLSANPCHASVTPANYIELDPGDWTHGTAFNENYAEYTVSSFSGGGGGGGTGAQGALPIELLSFTGEAQERTNLLSWVTLSEQGVLYHEIQRSSNGYEWESIGQVEGQLDSRTKVKYEFVDNNPIRNAYYRLKTIEINESNNSRFSNLVLITRRTGTFGVANVFPSPATSKVQVQFEVEKESEIQLRVTDITGKLVMQKQIDAQAGMNLSELFLQDLANGTYLISVVESGVASVPYRIIKQ